MTNDSNHTDSSVDESPINAFSLIGNEVRAEIIKTFGDARVEEGSRPVLTFSEIRSRTDLEIRSSRFNYHLQELVGNYLERLDEGYRMRPEGRSLYTSIRAGTFMRQEDERGFKVDLDCYYCDSPVEARFENGYVTVKCPQCEHVYDNITAPAGATDEDGIDIEKVKRYNDQLHLQYARGGCPFCGDQLGAEFLHPSEVPYSGAERQKVYIYRSCDTCGSQMYLTIGQILLTDPGLISFCHRHGLDVLATPFWEIEFAATDRYVTVDSSDPWKVTLQVVFDEDTLEVVIDESLSIIERNYI